MGSFFSAISILVDDRRRDVGMFEESRKNLGKSWGEESVIASAAIGSRLAYSAWG